MMEEDDFTRQLKNRINEVFDHYPDDTADAGWALLRQKYPQKNRKYSLLWLLPILLLSGIFYWFSTNHMPAAKTTKSNRKEIQSAKQVAEKQATTATKSEAQEQTSLKFKKTKSEPENDLVAQKHPNREAVKIDSQSVTKNTSSTLQSADKKIIKSKKPTQTVIDSSPNIEEDIPQKTHFKADNQSQRQTSIQPLKQATNQIELDDKDNKQLVRVRMNKLPKAREDVIVQPEKINNQVSKPKTTEVAFSHSSKKDSTINDHIKTFDKNSKKHHKISLAIYAGPHLNYASGSSTKFGLGAGVMATIPFTKIKNLQAVTGLQLLQNNLQYQNQIPQSSLYAANSSLPNSITNINNTINQLNARFLQMELPLNLAYRFNSGKKSISISAGTSAGFFATQRFTYSYLNSLPQTQTESHFSNFYLAKTVDLAVTIPFSSKYNALNLEPFVVIPIGSISSQQLKFGTVGINLKLNLNNFKK